MIQFDIILNDEDYVPSWDKFSSTISDSWDWDNENLSLADYNKFFNAAMVKEGMIPNINKSNDESIVTFTDANNLTLFLLKWA